MPEEVQRESQNIIAVLLPMVRPRKDKNRFIPRPIRTLVASKLVAN